MANVIQLKSGTGVPSGNISKSELVIRHVDAAHTTSSSSMLYIGEDADNDGVTIRALGTGMTGDSGQGGATIGGSMTFTGGNAITTSVSGAAVTINHDDTSSQSSVNNSGTTFIQDITLDTYGHVTGITSADAGSGSVSGDTFATDLKIGRDSHNNIDFSTDDQVTFNVANAAQLVLTNNLLAPSVDDDLDLGSSSKGFQDLYLEGNLNFTDDSNVTNVSNITGHSGANITLDSANGIILDGTSASVGIQYKDGGAELLRIHNYDGSSADSNVHIESKVSDKDILFKGNDGGSTITALTLDMSASGKAVFNDTIEVGDNVNLKSDGAVIGFGADSDVTLEHQHNTGLRLNSTNQLQFGDAGTYIHQSADGVLDLVSDTEIEINATTIDMNGALNLSGNATIGGFVLDGNTITGVNDSGEFDDDDSHIMTSAGVNDRIQAFGYTTNTGDITGVTAGTGLSGGGSSGGVTLNVSGLTVSELAGGSLTTSSESFADNDTTLMTSAAINDRIESFGYTTNTGDITGVTAGTGLSGGGSSGAVTLNVEATQTINTLNSTGFTLDSSGDITLDADGADIILKDGGTAYGRLDQESSGLAVYGGNQTSIKTIQTDSAGKYTTGHNFVFVVTAGMTNLGSSSAQKLLSFNTTNGNTSASTPGNTYYNQVFTCPCDLDLLHVYGTFNKAISNASNMGQFKLTVADDGSTSFSNKLVYDEMILDPHIPESSFSAAGLNAAGRMFDFLVDAGHNVTTGSIGTQSFTAGQKIAGSLKVSSSVNTSIRGSFTLVFRTTGGLP